MRVLISEHEVDEVAIARTWLLALLALAAVWLFLVALDIVSHGPNSDEYVSIADCK